jgi:hypothetical protein
MVLATLSAGEAWKWNVVLEKKPRINPLQNPTPLIRGGATLDEKNGRAVLTNRDWRAIYLLYSDLKIRASLLAEIFGVTRQHIHRIITRMEENLNAKNN